ncbi:hypothetical protein, partial [Shigella sonnei]
NCDRRWMPNHDRFECQTAIDSDAILHPFVFLIIEVYILPFANNKITNYSDATATNITFVEHYHAETRND